MERMVRRFRLYSPPVYTGVAVFVGVAFALSRHLASLTRGRLAPGEVRALVAHPSWHSIWNNLLYGPYFGLLRLVHYGNTTPFYNRLAGAALGLVASALLYLALQRWVGWRLSTLGLILFGTSGALLHSARLVNPAVMQLLAVTFLLAWYALSHKQPRPWHFAAGLVGTGLLVYAPATVVLIVCAWYLNRSSMRSAWLQASKKLQALSIIGALALLAPLGYFLAGHGLRTFLAWLGYGLPFNLGATADFGRGLAHVPLHLFIRGSNDATVGLSRQPLIDGAVGFLAVLGGYIAFSRFHEGRWRLLIVLGGAGWLLAACGGLSEAALAPIVYVLATVGLAYLLSEWYRVFPRNPIARTAGLLCIVLVVAISSLYELRAYFVAWPHNAATTAAFVCPPQSLPPQGCNLVQ